MKSAWLGHDKRLKMNDLTQLLSPHPKSLSLRARDFKSAFFSLMEQRSGDKGYLSSYDLTQRREEKQKQNASGWAGRKKFRTTPEIIR